VGQVTHLSGPLFAVKDDGTRRALSVGSQVEAGEILVTETKTYAQVRFNDKGVVTLKPDSQFRIDRFSFEEQAPEKDNALFALLKGALRTVTGLIGKRGNADAYRMNTPMATIGIRGTGFGLTQCPGAAGCERLPAGAYLDVFEGAVSLGPPLPPPGEPPPVTPPPPPIVLTAGQFGFQPPVGAPQQLPSDPGLGQHFQPPPAFSRPSAGEAPPAQAGCIVR